MQILLDPRQKQILQREAKKQKSSVGHVIREAVELYEKQKLDEDAVLRQDDAIWKIIGMIRGKQSDASEEHDHYIYGTPKKKKFKS